MGMYYDNVLKKEETTLHFPNFKNRDGVQKLVAGMPDDQALGEWELHSRGYEMDRQSSMPYRILESRHHHNPDMVDVAASLCRATHLRLSALL